MLAIDDAFTFGKDVEPGVGMTNFYPPEDGFIWSMGTWCQISLSRPPSVANARKGGPAASDIDLALDLDVFKSIPGLEGQNVFFYVNGLRLASRFVSRRLTVMLDVPGDFVRARDNIITIDTPDAARPCDFEVDDPRRLGIQLFSLKVSGA